MDSEQLQHLAISSGASRLQSDFMCLAVTSQNAVCLLTHEIDKFSFVSLIDSLLCNVCLSCCGAVPVKVKATRTPTAAVVLTDQNFGQFNIVWTIDRLVRPTNWQFPAHLWLGYEWIDTKLIGQDVQRATVTTFKSIAVVKNARPFEGSSLVFAIVILFEHATLMTFVVVLPQFRREHVCVLPGLFHVFFVAKVSAKGAATNVGVGAVDAFAAVAPDAHPTAREPGEVAPVNVGVILGVDELDPLSGEI